MTLGIFLTAIEQKKASLYNLNQFIFRDPYALIEFPLKIETKNLVITNYRVCYKAFGTYWLIISNKTDFKSSFSIREV